MSNTFNNGKLFGKINILDLIIVIVLLSLIIGGAYKVLNVETKEIIVNKPVKVKMLVAEREKFSLDDIQVGDIIKEYDTGITFGEIENIEVKPNTKFVEKSNGEIVESEVPDLYDLYITVKGNATITQNSIVSGNKELRVGSPLVFRTKLYALRSLILEVEEL